MFKEGWTWLHNSKKWHYFVDGRSLCGRWMLFSNPGLEQGNDDSPDNCKACSKKLITRKAGMTKETLNYLKSLEQAQKEPSLRSEEEK